MTRSLVLFDTVTFLLLEGEKKGEEKKMQHDLD